MPKGSNQKFKFTYVMQILLENTDEEHGITLPRIQKELEARGVSAERKSLYNDIASLEEFGIEVEKEQIGRETYYRVVERQFEVAEVKLLIDAIQSSRFVTEKKSKELIDKVKTLVSRHQAKNLQRQVYVHGRPKTENEQIYYAVDSIHSAIANNRQISFLYCAWDTKKKLVPRKNGELYQVSPWMLIWADDNYYLVAYDSVAKKVKHYRVDKMLKLTEVEEEREGRKEFENISLVTYSKQSFGMYGGQQKRVHIEFPDSMVGVFIDRFGTDLTIREAGEGRSRIAVDVFVSGQFFGWIFGLGPEVKVTGPEDVVEAMQERLEAFHKSM